MKTQTWLCLSLVTVTLLFLSACGGAQSTGSPKPATPTATAAAGAPSPAVPPAAGTPSGGSPAVPTTAPTPAATPAPVSTTAPATATAAGPQPRAGGTLRARTIQDWGSWDSYTAAGASSVGVFLNSFNNLITSVPQEAATLLPDLAERWEQSADGNTYTFFIRKGVKWHDGKDLTAKDVVWNLDRALKGEPPAIYNKPRFLNVASITAPDEFTVKIAMKQPSASFLPNLGIVFLQIYAPHGPNPSALEFKDNVIGSGPFKMKSYSKNVKWELIKNESYFKKDEAGRQLPYLDGITIFILPDTAAGLAAFRAGQIDCGCAYDTDFLTANYDAIKRDVAGVKLQIGNSAIIRLVFNQRAPWTDARVRRAVWTALDRVKVRDLYRGGRGYYPPGYVRGPEVGGKWGLPASELLQVPGFKVTRDGKKDPADVELSRQLFKDAGVDPTKLTAVVAGSAGATADAWEIIGAAIQDATGIKVDLKLEDVATNTQRKAANNEDIYAIYGQDALDDPSDALPRFALSNSPENFSKWQRPEIDALYQKVESELDSSKRQQLTLDLQRKLFDEAVATPLFYNVGTWGTYPYVNGFTAGAFSSGPHLRLERVWLEKR